MSTLRTKVGVCTAALSCLLAGFAAAQQGKQATGRSRSDQSDRPAEQRVPPYTAQYRGTPAAKVALNQEVEQYLANGLWIKNQAAIEIGQFAQQQAQNPQVKQFARQLVEEHRQLAQKLRQLPGVQAADPTSPSAGARGQFDGQQPTPASDGPGQAFDRRANQSLASDRPAAQSGALGQLLEIDRQITDRCTEMVREELQTKSSTEFDQCFLRAQIGSQANMLAALEIVGQKTSGELRQVVQDAQPTIRQHLDRAKQLMKEQEAGDQAGAPAERQPGRTQR